MKIFWRMDTWNGLSSIDEGVVIAGFTDAIKGEPGKL